MADLRYRPRPEALRELFSDFNRAASSESLCVLVAERLAQDPAISGVRVYALRSGDVCDVCARREACEGRVTCLHLVGTGGMMVQEAAAADRVPPTDTDLGDALHHEAPRISHLGSGVRISVPLRVHNEPIGLVAVYASREIPPDRLVWMLLLLDAAAAALHALRSVDACERRIEELGAQNDLMRGLLSGGDADAGIAAARAGHQATVSHTVSRPANGPFLTEAEMRAFEKENTRAVLEHTDWRVYGDGGAAQLLGIRPTTLMSRIKKMGLRRATEEVA